ncbi:MAG: hypothetical protein ACI9DJ_000744 [Algoriphagus sp.]|jgi:hypothetical protein
MSQHELLPFFLIFNASNQFLSAQDLAGRKIVNGNLSAQITSEGRNKGTNTVLSTSILFG